MHQPLKCFCAALVLPGPALSKIPHGTVLAYVYFEDDLATRRATSKRVTRMEALALAKAIGIWPVDAEPPLSVRVLHIRNLSMGVRGMSAGQKSGTGAKTELDDEKVRKNDILSNREKAQRPAGRGLDGKGVQVDEYKDNPANRRPPRGGKDHEGHKKADSRDEHSADPADSEQVDRPGFDLGGATGETDAGKGLGLGDDAKENRKGWRLPR